MTLTRFFRRMYRGGDTGLPSASVVQDVHDKGSELPSVETGEFLPTLVACGWEFRIDGEMRDRQTLTHDGRVIMRRQPDWNEIK
jgi:hypothetical protein